MKINSFLNKEITKTKASTKSVITLGNGVKEQSYREQINSLEQEVSRLSIIEKDSQEWWTRMTKAEGIAGAVESLEQAILNKQNVLEESIQERDKMRDQVFTISQEMSKLENSVRETETLLAHEQETSQSLNTQEKVLLTRVETQQNEINELSTDLTNSKQNEHGIMSELGGFKIQLDNLTQQVEHTDQESKTIKKENGQLSGNLNYWKLTAMSLQDEKDHLTETSKALTKISKLAEIENIEYKGLNKNKNRELVTLKEALKIMTDQVAGLVEDNTYLAGLSADLKLELKKPRYASMSAIERSEGFKMPMGGYRKHYLGHGKPTLLKFKTGGIENDN